MREPKIQLEIDCPPDRFWRVYFQDGFTRDTFVEGLGWDAPEITELRETEAEIVRSLIATPKLDLPGKLAKLLGDRFGYQEFGRFNRNEQVWHLRHKANTLGDKIKIQGEVASSEIAGGRTRLDARFEIECSMFGVGGMLERTAEQNFNDAWTKCGRYWNRWLAKNPEAGLSRES